MSFVYIIENETDACGAWTTPEKAVRAYFDGYIDDDDMVDGCGPNGELVSVEDAIRSMSDPCADYPVLTRVPLDNPKGGYGSGCWYRDS